MEIYRVGGAVRDRLLGLEQKDCDWVVVGATPEQMIQLGFKPVGQDFPVFLHPVTKEEYALARTERKTAPGYKGFQFQSSADISLEDDLRRRDLTINAIAENSEGKIIDPYNGVNDLKQRRLRHVSDAFAEDPVRILRTARFSARFASMGFKVADDTLSLMRKMVENGEANTLVAERVWTELSRALTETQPHVFFETLRNCSALSVIFPEIDKLFGIPQRAEHHPEIDTGLHTMLVLKRAAQLSDNPIIRFAALTHDLGKGETPKSDWPRHPNHETRGAHLVKTLCARLRAPKAYQDLAVSVARYHGDCHRITTQAPEAILHLLKAVDAFRKPEKFTNFLICCQADAQGRLGREDTPYPQALLLRSYYTAACQISTQRLLEQGLKGPALGHALDQRRIEAIAEIHSKNI